MRIRLPVAAPVRYNPAYYLEKSFRVMGHDARVIDQTDLYEHKPEDADLFVAVDSGGPLNIPANLMHKTMFWFIDSRRNSDPAVRTPDDDTVARELLEEGGFIFQAQRQDSERLQGKIPQSLHKRVMWLPLAADPDVWTDEPQDDGGAHASWMLTFVGNCFDPERHTILHTLMDEGYLIWPGIEGAIMEHGAAQYRFAAFGLNVPSWLGTPLCYDVNMRVFEVLSCGRPLITNALPDLKPLGILEGEHVFTYPTPTGQQEPGEAARNVIRDVKEIVNFWKRPDRIEKRAAMGLRARQLILSQHTYEHRARTILVMFSSFMRGSG